MKGVYYSWSMLLALLFSGIVISIPCAQAASARTFDININNEIAVNIHAIPATGNSVLLWFPSESGLLEQEKYAAEKLALKGSEVWFADLLSAWFLPALPSSIDKLPASELADLIEAVRKKSNKRITLIANGRGAVPVLRAVRSWQRKYGASAKLAGVILISPKLFVETPEPGLEGSYMPVVGQSNVPIFIIQPANSPWRWKLEKSVEELSRGGSDVYVRVLENIRDRFYYRPDATKLEDDHAVRLSDYLANANRLLDSFNSKSRHVQPVTRDTPAVTASHKKERALRTYAGEQTPPDLRLKNLQGDDVDLINYRGKVVLVNFWASWCPPCVHEMPSMQRMSDHFSGKPFEILAVNMAEDSATVKTFLQEKVNVRFPILMDTDGKALTRWRVFAFPTSYVIGRKGKIRLALYGAIDWMQDDVLQQIRKLVAE